MEDSPLFKVDMSKDLNAMRDLVKHLGTNILRGLLAVIPLALTAFEIRILYTTIDKRFTGAVERIIGFSLPGLGVLFLLATLYFLGLVISNVGGDTMLSIPCQH